MPTDAELRRLFHETPSPPATIDADAVIRRSRRRRLPQQLGAGSVLTLAVAGIGVASINGVQSLAPMGAAETAVDAPMGVSESGPLGGAENSVPDARQACATGMAVETELRTSVELVPRFPASAATGQQVTGILTVTNIGTEQVNGALSAAMVGISRGGAQVWHSGASAAETTIALAPGESMNLPFSFAAVDCDPSYEAVGAPLDPGRYELSAIATLVPDDAPGRVIGGPASAITLR
jgi:hypothetical protein